MKYYNFWLTFSKLVIIDLTAVHVNISLKIESVLQSFKLGLLFYEFLQRSGR